MDTDHNTYLILSGAAFCLASCRLLFFVFQYQTFCTASLSKHIRSCTTVFNKWVQSKNHQIPSPTPIKMFLVLEQFCGDPPRLRTLGTSCCTDCHCCARVAGPNHCLVEAADARVLSLHGGPKRPRHCESDTYCEYYCTGMKLRFASVCRCAKMNSTQLWWLCVLAPLQYSKHLFVHIGQTNPSYSDPLLEAVDIRQIYDKFPEKKGGLKELYEKGPQNAFFLVKFWVSWRHRVAIRPIPMCTSLCLRSVLFQKLCQSTKNIACMS